MLDGINIPLLNGEYIAVCLPGSKDSLAGSEKVFDTACNVICTQWSLKLENGEHDYSWLQNVCYGYLSLMITHGFSFLFEERIERFGRDAKGLGAAVNPFQRGLLAIFAHDKDSLIETPRETYGKRLWYAYRHYVPTPFLNGFLHDVYNRDARRRANTNYIEPDFYDWVMMRRSEDSAPETRGKYPKDLEMRVRLFTLMVPIADQHHARSKQARAKREISREQEP